MCTKSKGSLLADGGKTERGSIGLGRQTTREGVGGVGGKENKKVENRAREQ